MAPFRSKIPYTADPLPVITAHPGQLVQIQHMPGGVQGLAGGGILMAALHLTDPPFQPGVAGVVSLALADDRLDGRGDQPLGQQHAGQQGQVLLLDGALQRDAGGGDRIGRCGLPSAARHLPCRMPAVR